MVGLRDVVAPSRVNDSGADLCAPMRTNCAPDADLLSSELVWYCVFSPRSGPPAGLITIRFACAQT